MRLAQLRQQQLKMKLLVLFGLIGAAVLQAETVSIGVQSHDYEMPKVLRETIEQSFSCGMQMGERIHQVPKLRGIQILPEDNDALCELWGCIWKKKGIVEESGDVHSDVLENYLVDLSSIVMAPSSDDLKLAHKMTNECKNEKAHRYCHKAIKIQNCISRLLLDNNNLFRR